MLTDLIIKNFAIIEQLHVAFGRGFTVLTGETGAGKSIIIDAVELLLGGRARAEVIRTGADSATVEAVFQLAAEAPLRRLLEDAELAVDDELVVRRILSRSGKNRAFINGSVVPVAQLRELVGSLINIYGQHEHQTLQRADQHLELLDEFAGNAPCLAAYRTVYADYRKARLALDDFDRSLRQRRQQLDMLSFVQQELAAAQLQPDEDQALEQERSLLLHAEKLIVATQGGYESLYAGEGATCEVVAELMRQLGDLRDIDPQLGTLADTLQEAHYLLEDAALQLRDYAARLDFEPQRQQQVEERLALIERLKRKYAPTVAGLLEHLAATEEELARLQAGDSHREELQQQLAQARAALDEAACHLTRKREEAAEGLSRAVTAELAQLAMPQAQFTFVLSPLDEPGERGREGGEFYLAANPGEAAQPLAKIASGGELSRIMLALRRCAPVDGALSCLVFDEVDAGIGGEAATAVGEKIGRTARQVQVLCVTHLPQVAAFADEHYRVTKSTLGGRTATRVEPLDAEARVEEMARMLGGSKVSEQTRKHARELIEVSARHLDDEPAPGRDREEQR